MKQISIQELQKLGFSEKEAQVYLMLLRIGPAPASTLARRVEMKRVTVYSVLQTLQEKGLVSFEETRSGRRYIPHDPECLLEYLEEEYSDIKFRLNLAKNCVEKLKTVQTKDQAETLGFRFLHGEGKVRRYFSFHLNPSEHFYCFIFGDKPFSEFKTLGLSPSSQAFQIRIQLPFETEQFKLKALFIQKQFLGLLFEEQGELKLLAIHQEEVAKNVLELLWKTLIQP